MNEKATAASLTPKARTVPAGARRRRRWRWVAGAFVVVVILVILMRWLHAPPAAQFVTAPITEGDVVPVIVTTGTINPVRTVQVGSYVSGTINSLSCDYNSKVKAGEVCATIDPRPYRVVYDQASANLASAEAQLKKDQASLAYERLNHDRDAGLRTQGVVSQDTLDSDKRSLDQAIAQIAVDKAAIKQRQAALAAAKVNLDYTKIVSPVDGTVISRSIDVGQTVASSFQTPTLFLIAKDLTEMQVDTSVSESDVGGAKVGQKALFTVEAFPGRSFEGKVTQVRVAPISVQNVVTYDVVIRVANPELLLLPGMTANVRIVLSEHKDVLRVPVQALRFTLSRFRRSGGESPRHNGTRHHQESPHIYLLIDGKPRRIPVTSGLSDGTNVEVSGAGLKAGDLVIVNEITAEAARSGPPRRFPMRF